MEGIADLLATIERVRAALNPGLAIDGVVLTMYDDRTNLGQQVSANIREYFGDQVYRTVIPRNIRLGEAPSHGLPIILYDARSRGADAYVALAHEFLARERAGTAAEPPASQAAPTRANPAPTTSEPAPTVAEPVPEPAPSVPPPDNGAKPD